ncbi:MAG: 4Fe-4S single cluster domain-containing protein [Armatimonadota bacterium]
MSQTHIDIDGAAAHVQGLGPGERLVIWLRGCSRRCDGCIAPELWDSGEPTPIDEVSAYLLSELQGCGKLTVSGGEPMDQPEALLELIRQLRSVMPDLEVLVYSGNVFEELQTKSVAHTQLLGQIDMLVDGAFEIDTPNTLQWRGSDNQRVLLLSERAQCYRDQTELPWPEQRPIQVQMCSATEYRVIGIPKRGGIEQYRELMRQRGIEVGPSI